MWVILLFLDGKQLLCGEVVPNVKLAVLLCLGSIIQAVFLAAKAWRSNQQLNSYKKYKNIYIYLMDFIKDEL